MNELLQPIQIGKMRVKNRMVMGPMNTNFTNENGAVTAQIEAFYRERARNGIGLIVMEACSVTDETVNHAVQPLLTNDKYIPGWFNVVDCIHGYGAKASVEIVHYGSEGEIGKKLSASDISSRGGFVQPLTIGQIAEIQNQFVAASERAKKAGFDAITVHAVHGYLLAQFLSPLHNRRTDEYGGSLENRSRFLVESIAKIKTRLGSDYPVMVRFSATEFVTGGWDLEESRQLAVILEKAGVAALDLSSCTASNYIFSIRPNNMGDIEGFLVPYSRAIKEVVSIPVICAGGMRDPDKLSALITAGDLDMVTLGRSLLADEQYARKVMERRSREIRHCLSCQECLASLNSGKNVRCTVNSRTGREYQPTSQKAESPQKVLVVGAGPAGMAAALTSAQRGHSVILCDQAEQLGGTMRAGCIPPGKERMRGLVQWYERELRQAMVDVRLSCPLTGELVKSLAPDVIIQATGAEYMRMMDGADKDFVITATEALLHPQKVGERIVVIGGGVSGSEVAEYFTEGCVEVDYHRTRTVSGDEIEYSVSPGNNPASRNVTIVEMRDSICADMYDDNARLMRIKLHESGVISHLNTRVEKIETGKVYILDDNNGERSVLDADTVVLAAGLKSLETTVSLPENIPVYKVGDAAGPGKIMQAIHAGDTLGGIL